MPSSEAFRRALAAAKRAVELDDSSAAAHASLGFSLAYGDWSFGEAQREFRRAISLAPSYVPAHHWYANMLMIEGRADEALSEIESARKLDPTSHSILADKGLILFASGRAEEGIAQLQQVEVVEPSFPSPYRYLAYIYFEQGRYAESFKELRMLAPLLNDAVAIQVVDKTSHAYESGGLAKLYAAQMALHREGLLAATTVATTSSVLGRKQEVLAYLREALSKRELELLGIWLRPSMSPMRGNSEFQNLVAKLPQ